MLEQRRAETIERIEQLAEEIASLVAASADSNADDEHDPEGATIAFERAQAQAMLDEARSAVSDVDAALTRVADGTYGICAVCGQSISPQRLAARPAARTCIDCATADRLIS
ncbi:transcriptional regulator, TraR/DksA family [Frankineae bacterium MT45]|nr:transcriptional regulator, TraR/DksA family [Frankineae bacterium MT45]